MKLSRIILVIAVSVLLSGAGFYQYSEKGVTSALTDAFALLREHHQVIMHVHDKKVLKPEQNNHKVRWYSGNEKIASVSQRGTVSAHKIGRTMVYAVGAMHAYKCHVLVEKRRLRSIDCIGDSITYGTGVFPHQKTDSFPALLSHQFTYHVKVRNYGVPSRTLQKEGDEPYVRTGFLKKTEKDQPDVILFMLGTNDCRPNNWNKKRFMKEYEMTIKKLKKITGHPDIYLMIPPQLSMSYPSHATRIKAAYIEKLPGMIKRAGKVCQVHVINLHHILNKKTDYSDKVHPNKKGNQKIVTRIRASLSKEYKL